MKSSLLHEPLTRTTSWSQNPMDTTLGWERGARGYPAASASESRLHGRFCTTLAIAHRLSTLRNADRLVLIDDGQVLEEGSHEELMAREGAFFELVRLQQQVSSVMAVGAQ